MKKILLISLILVSLYFINQSQTDITTIQYQFVQWKNDFGKTYSSQAELEYRFNIFTQNLDMIQQHNSKQDVSYQMGLNKFADLTNEEFISTYLTNNIEEIQPTHDTIEQPNQDQLKSLPNSVDWRGITQMKDQGACGGGWAFSVVGTLEAFQLLRKAEQVQLSEQNLIDCDNQSKGCDSGNNVNGYRYLQNSGTNLSSKYEYKGVKDVCRLSIGPYKIGGYGFVVGEYGLKQALNNYPASAGVDAQKWQFYKTGIYSDCGLTWNHYVMVVGYEDDGTWIVKNSWGANWGEAGHIRLKNGNTCGVLSQAYQNK